MKLQVENLKGQWVSIARGSEDGLRRDADTLWEVMSVCSRVVGGSRVVYSRVDSEHYGDSPGTPLGVTLTNQCTDHYPPDARPEDGYSACQHKTGHEGPHEAAFVADGPMFSW